MKGFIINFEVARVDDKLMPNLKNRVGKDPVRKGTNRSSGKPIMTPSSVDTEIDYSSPRPITVSGRAVHYKLRWLIYCTRKRYSSGPCPCSQPS